MKEEVDVIQVLEKVLDDFWHDGDYCSEDYHAGFDAGVKAAIKAIDKWMNKEKTPSAKP